ncbi:adhesion G-protein coupled receptor F3 [Boleophthalmus pectinirostris]|uniref:adhesion G-protein coupled receptor F3 n=1 Tax=Boleophthalmus pectinirostris TaxID=150288 RepID=UPI002430E337|nr:adhesion G-protein coupled receptor F3 [Boleophthalmus pectinirostris]
MWVLLFFCVLGLCLTQVHGVDSLLHTNSTQMHYMTLVIDEKAFNNVSENLLHQDYFFDSFTLNSLNHTTECDWFNQISGKKNCRCMEGYKWRDETCLSQPQCCGTNKCDNPPDICTSSKTVNIRGSLVLDSQFYIQCLDTPSSDKYEECHKNVTKEIQTYYSRIYGFDSLKIIRYRPGSVIVEFQVVIAEPVEPSILQDTSMNLTKFLSAKLDLQTTGVVRLSVPKRILDYGSSATLNCTSTTDLRAMPSWNLTNYMNQTKKIHNGTESNIISSAMGSTVKLSSVSQLWKGWYSCSFIQNENQLNIHHTAVAHVDICVKPKITIRTNPGFPFCNSSNGLNEVTISCEVEQNYETYNVSWEKENTTSITPLPHSSDAGMDIFSVITHVSCSSINPQVTCTLINRCGQETEASINIKLIKVGDPHCSEEKGSDWKPTPVEHMAEIKCSGSVGTKQRYCNKDETWGEETSLCVNPELHSVLNDAGTSDIGLGALQDNAANVFDRLHSITTEDSSGIKTVANLNTSVMVINTMNSKLESIDRNTVVSDFLKTSSNLLNESLAHSWTSVQKIENSKKSLAEMFLFSVEELINKAGMNEQGTFQNLQVVSCILSKSECVNKVFNNTVTMKGASIKTTGFQHLEKYLSNNSSYIPNSIVVSTTRQLDTDQKQEPVTIQIKFSLSKSRPRNFELKCSYRDKNASDWSQDGCKWISDSTCECNHLSSFVILMSKTKLEVPYLTEVSYVGLSVSIVCLIICLVVELIIWHDVVKTDTLHLRHCAHVNISLCLLIGDICFLASALPEELNEVWCKTFVVVEHFCYLAMFFWMFCLSSILLHKTVYVSLHGIGKTAYLRYSMVVGYVCPLLIVVITFLANNGAEGQYYSKETRWLVYNGVLKGSIFTFILPIGTIVFINMFFMCLVIMKLLQPIKAQQMLEDKDKNSAKTVIRSVILLTPVFGLTWGLGFLMIIFDLSNGFPAYAIHYLFTIMNAFQGLYIFITTCVADKMVREGLLRYIRKKTTGVSSFSSNSSVDQSSIKKPSQN